MTSVRRNKVKSTELRLIGILRELCLKGWRHNYKLKGNPDFVFLKEKIAVFTDGYFWHGHDCRNVTPEDNEAHWKTKVLKNKTRDIEITKYM